MTDPTAPTPDAGADGAAPDAPVHDAPAGRRGPWRWVVAAVLVLVLAGGAGVWWFFGQDAPAEVDLDAAVAGVDPADAPTITDLTGTWQVVSGEGTFSYNSATGTFAGFRVTEELANVGATEAVGRTGQVTGSVTIDGSSLLAAGVAVDLASITTDRSQRDGKVREALEVSTYPNATFALTSPVELPPGALSGAPVQVVANGELTIHGVTRIVAFPLEARLVRNTVVIVGQLEVSFADYGVTVPSSPVVLSVADTATLELQLLLTR